MPRWCRTARARPRTRPSPISPWRPARRRSRPARCRAPTASRSTTSCCASKPSSVRTHATQAPRLSRCRCPGYRADAMKFVAAGLLILLVLLQYRLWFGDGSVREVAQLQTQISAQEEQNAKLRERNRTLAAEVQDLKKGTTAIEERARTDLGMVGKSATFYQVVSPENAPPASEPAAPLQTSP